MKRISILVSGEKNMQERLFSMDNKGMESAMLYIRMAVCRGDSVWIDTVECEDAPVPEYLKDYSSI